MLLSENALKIFGSPNQNSSYLVYWTVPDAARYVWSCLPSRILCHKLLIPHLSKAFFLMLGYGLKQELQTYDGCFQIRYIKGTTKLSLHSWGLAIDFNKDLPQPDQVVKSFRRANFDWGGDFKHIPPDPMHFQIKEEFI